MDDQLVPHSDDLAAMLAAVGAAPAHLVGNSWGAFVCLLTAIRHPDAVRSLVLEEPPVIPLAIGSGNRPNPRILLGNLLRHQRRTLTILQFGARTIAPVQKAFRRGDDETAMWTFLRGVLGPDVAQRIPDPRQQQMRENTSALKAQMLGAGFPPVTPQQVRNIRVPTLLVTGEHSPTFLPALTGWLAELLPDREQAPGGFASDARGEHGCGQRGDSRLPRPASGRRRLTDCRQRRVRSKPLHPVPPHGSPGEARASTQLDKSRTDAAIRNLRPGNSP